MSNAPWAMLLVALVLASAPLRPLMAQLNPDDDESLDYFCGLTWREANSQCAFPCPDGIDASCPPLDDDTERSRKCFAAAGCYPRRKQLKWTGLSLLEFEREGHLLNVGATSKAPTSAPSVVSFWNEDLTNITSIPTTTPITTVATTTTAIDMTQYLMKEDDKAIFESALLGFLKGELAGVMEITAVEVLSQEYDRPCVGVVIPDRRRRRLPRNSLLITSIDTLVRISAQYIPVPEENDGGGVEDEIADFTNISESEFSALILGTINRNPEAIANDVIATSFQRKNTFFLELKRVVALEEDDVAETPSYSPSSAPSRSRIQELETETFSYSRSYGILFRVKTKSGVPTIKITGMSFATISKTIVDYEVYTKSGHYNRHYGNIRAFERIAAGRTEGKGDTVYTPILTEEEVREQSESGTFGGDFVGFKPAHVAGNGGERSFYVTLKTRGLISSSAFNPENEGETSYSVSAYNREIEFLEGDGALNYLFAKNSDMRFYNRPRGFLGAIEYDKSPCHPNFNFTGWPCPYVPPTPPPTGAPVPTTPTPTILDAGGVVPATTTTSPTVEVERTAPNDGLNASTTGPPSMETSNSTALSPSSEDESIVDVEGNDSATISWAWSVRASVRVAMIGMIWNVAYS